MHLRTFSWVIIICLFPIFEAFSSCGSANCPINTYRPMGAGWFFVEFSHEYIDQNRLFAGTSLSSVGAIPSHHDEIRTLNSIERLSLNAGVSDRLSMQFSIPYIHREHAHIGHEGGSDILETWNFNGIGDAVVSLSYALVQTGNGEPPLLTLSGGFKLATGVTDIANSGGEPAEVTIQPGTGSTDEIIGLQVYRNITTVPAVTGKYYSLPLRISATATFPGTGSSGYRFGRSVLGTAGTAWQFMDQVALLMQLSGKVQDYADPGSTGEPGGNTGGTWIFASPGLNFNIMDGIDATVYGQIPLYQNVHGIQQTAPMNWYFGLAYHFGLLSTD